MAKKEYFATITTDKGTLRKCKLSAEKENLSILGVTDKFSVGKAVFPDGVEVEIAVERLPEGCVAEVAHWGGVLKAPFRQVNHVLDGTSMSFMGGDSPRYYVDVDTK